MALTCPTDLTGVDFGFTSFIECESISIAYDILGTANVNFTVVSVSQQPTPNDYTSLTFGGINFTGYITNLEVRRIPGTLVYEHRYTLVGAGCAQGT